MSEHGFPMTSTGPVLHGRPSHGAPTPWDPSRTGHPWPSNPVLVVGKGMGLRPMLNS